MIIFTIADLTVREAQRRRILWLAMLMGLGFLAVFTLGFYYIYKELREAGMRPDEISLASNFLRTAGLYATNFLIVVMSVLTSVTTIAGEIDSHIIETIITKPIHRWQVVLGKWLAYGFLLLVYISVLAGGIILIVYLISGQMVDNFLAGIGLMILQGLVILSISIAGGTRLSTLANGVLAFALYGIAFLGGWVEQIGGLLRNETAVNIGIVTSLLMPGEILWKKVVVLFQPAVTNNPQFAGPFAISSQPSNLMIGYAVFYAFALLLLALWSFSSRDL